MQPIAPLDTVIPEGHRADWEYAAKYIAHVAGRDAWPPAQTSRRLVDVAGGTVYDLALGGLCDVHGIDAADAWEHPDVADGLQAVSAALDAAAADLRASCELLLALDVAATDVAAAYGDTYGKARRIALDALVSCRGAI